MVGPKQVASKRCKIEVHDYPHATESNSTVTFSRYGSPINYVTEYIFLGLTLDYNLNFKSHLKTIGTKISRVIGLLHKLKYIFLANLLRMIYNSLILPHINYSLNSSMGFKLMSQYSVELLQKRFSSCQLSYRSYIKKYMNQFKLPD